MSDNAVVAQGAGPGALPDVEPLLRCVWGRDALNTADNPLQFVVHELGAIVERAPEGLKLEINTARKITVAIFVE